MTLDPADLRAKLAEIEPRAAQNKSMVRIVRAPGRVNLIGEHTDYNEGFVMPAAIGLETWIAYLPAADGRVELTLADSGEQAGFDLDGIGPRRGSWIDYAAGVAWSLAEAGMATHGLRGLVATTLPIGAGLSSSAAFELACAWALAGDAPPELDVITLARACQRAENEYVGVASGLMDQFASAVGGAGGALILDCRSLDYRRVALPSDCALVVCHTGSDRRLERSAYNQRRTECELAVQLIAQRFAAVHSLRDVDRGMLAATWEQLDPTAARRAEHVVRENERVLATERALDEEDLDSVGRLWAESHASLRDLYEVSSAELDALVEIAAATPGVVAARLTGAGFGGCTVTLVQRAAVGGLRTAITREYPRRTGRTPTIWEVEPASGAGTVET
jgi:galactokinase